MAQSEKTSTVTPPPENNNNPEFARTSENTQQQPRKLKGIRWLICVLSIYTAVFLYALDNTVVATIQPVIIRSLGHLDKLPWVSIAYQVASVALDLTWGKFYGKFNGKLLFITSVTIFEIGSAICGAAPNIDTLIVGRAVCGVGGVGAYIGALNLLAESTTPSERPVYISLMGICWGSGTVLGPVIGGAFSDSAATWRWSFYINLVVGGAFVPAYVFLLPSTNSEALEIRFITRLKSIDWLGSILIAGATVSGIMGINFGGVLYPWSSGQIIGCFVCSGVCWIVFGLQQAFCILTNPEDRIFPCDIVRKFEADVLFCITAAGLGLSVVVIYFIPLYYQFVQGENALRAGVRLLPLMFLMIIASNVTGVALGRGFWFMPFALIGSILVVIGGALSYRLIGVNTDASLIYGFSILIGFGAGLFTQGPISVIQSLFPASRVADATAFVIFGQVTGVVLSLAIANAVFFNRATDAIQRLVPDAPLSEIHSAIEGLPNGFLSSLPEPLQSKVRQSVVASMNNAYILIFVAGAMTCVLCPFVKRSRTV